MKNIKIEKIDMNGNGICYLNNKITFIKKAALNDIVDIKIIKEHKSYQEAIIQKIIKRSEFRINPDCIYYEDCGGCIYRHVNYDYESLTKQNKVKDLLKDFKVKTNHIKAKSINYYRNKTVNPICQKTKSLGMYKANTHEIISIEECKISSKAYKIIAKVFNEWLKETKYSIRTDITKGLIRNLMIRENKDNELMLVIVLSLDKELNIEKLKEIPNVVEIYTNINKTEHNVILGDKNKLIYHKKEFYDTLCNLKFKIYPNTFLQVNREQTEKLYEIIKQYLNPKHDDIVLDCYCGVGTITLYIANYVKEILGVELVKEAIDCANLNKELNNINNASFLTGLAEDIVLSLDKKFNKIIVDPPRKGLDIKVVNFLKENHFKKIVYVSCNPATLKRDIELLSDTYKLVEYTTVDLFPRTEHIETVALLSTFDVDHHI